jgi:transcriptional regulator with XRE-family HTH domain
MFCPSETTEDEPILGSGMDRQSLGSRLRAWRGRAGLSQKALADLLDEPQPNIARWETGKMEIPGSRVPDIADALGITVEQLYGKPPPSTPPLRPGPKPKPPDPKK